MDAKPAHLLSLYFRYVDSPHSNRVATSTLGKGQTFPLTAYSILATEDGIESTHGSSPRAVRGVAPAKWMPCCTGLGGTLRAGQGWYKKARRHQSQERPKERRVRKTRREREKSGADRAGEGPGGKGPATEAPLPSRKPLQHNDNDEREGPTADGSATTGGGK